VLEMKKKRYFPFGYRMAGGQIEIVPEESSLLQNLFDNYLKGASLIKLAETAQQTGIKFRENTERWNKNMIARMLDDERYWNDNGFPPIVSKEIGSAITALRKQKTTSQCPIQFIKKKLVCCICGENINRNGKNAPRIRWDCPKCGWYFGPITDNELKQAVTEKLLAVCRNPQVAEPDQQPTNSLSIQAVRLTNEINQLLDQREVDTDRLLPLILECAAEKYKTCSIKESDHLTIKIKALFQEHSNDEELNRELFEQTVKQVILQPDGSIKFQLLNGKIV
jgi:hypothetical protein